MEAKATPNKTHLISAALEAGMENYRRCVGGEREAAGTAGIHWDAGMLGSRADCFPTHGRALVLLRTMIWVGKRE